MMTKGLFNIVCTVCAVLCDVVHLSGCGKCVPLPCGDGAAPAELVHVQGVHISRHAGRAAGWRAEEPSGHWCGNHRGS